MLNSDPDAMMRCPTGPVRLLSLCAGDGRDAARVHRDRHPRRAHRLTVDGPKAPHDPVMVTEDEGVRANTTMATPTGQGEREFTLRGHKWFFSAPMCDAHLVVARTADGAPLGVLSDPSDTRRLVLPSRMRRADLR